MTMLPRDDRMSLLVVTGALIAASVLSVCAMLTRPARGGEMMLCSIEPNDSGGWHYRTKVGGIPQICWYQGPSMKPRKELYWAEVPAVPPRDAPRDTAVPHSEFENRWEPVR